jgi:hypothetical protein
MARFDDELSIQRFEAVCREMEAENQDLNTSADTVVGRFTDPEELEAFFDWLHTSLEAAGPLITADEFVARVDSMNFLDADCTEELLEDMDMLSPTIVPIGFEGDILYRLATDPFGLQAHPRADTTPSGDLPLFQSCFLGINPTVPSEDTTNTPDFVFFQLGDLEYARRRNGRSGPWNDKDETNLLFGWQKTGFVMVARLGSSSGRVEGIYVIYDTGFREEDEEAWSGDIPPTSGDNQFSCARLGPRLSSFGKDHEVVWTEKFEHPVELVRVKRSVGDD